MITLTVSVPKSQDFLTDKHSPRWGILTILKKQSLGNVCFSASLFKIIKFPLPYPPYLSKLWKNSVTLFLGRNLLLILQVHLAFQPSYSTAVTTNFLSDAIKCIRPLCSMWVCYPGAFQSILMLSKPLCDFKVSYIPWRKINWYMVRKLIDTLQI